MHRGRVLSLGFISFLAALIAVSAQETYVNFESSHVHPLALTPSGGRLLAVNTPGATLEVFAVASDGSLRREATIPVGLEPVTVAARTDSEAWVVNHLSDTVSVVDLERREVVRTLTAGDEPTDVAFARGRAFVSVAGEDAVKVFDLARLADPPAVVEIFGDDPRALAVSNDGSQVYAVALRSGNRTTVVNANIIEDNASGLDTQRLQTLGLSNMVCNGDPPPYPPLPAGIQRNPSLTDPPSGQPPVGLIVRWDDAAGGWRDEAGQSWSHCLPFRLPDHDLFIIDAATLQSRTVPHLGTSLFEVSVHPTSGRVYVPHTEARNSVRFEHPLGVRGHMVENRLAIVDPAGGAPALVDLNVHIDRRSDPAANLAERQASVSQPGMLAWRRDGSVGYLAALGSRKVFAVDGACLSGGCIFGPDRSRPRAVETGEGPTGVALHEASTRLYVLNRFSNSISLVDAAALVNVGEAALNDPSSDTIRRGRRFLYDAIDTSGHGDAACSSCHLSGDMDGLAWDLGDPEGDFAPYGTPGDNVRFVIPLFGQPVECNPDLCAAHDGFDPQKGPMATQTLRGMLEPLHWRGDRPTLNAFNKAFVGLMGRADIGPINGEPAGLGAADMELFRQFALGIRFPPNPLRNVDDTLPNAEVPVPGSPFLGNPFVGQDLFLRGQTDAAQPCAACHQLPFGTAGGKLGGVQPGDPSVARTALFNGTADGSPHSDLEIPHMRNMYEKAGPLFGSHAAPPDRKTGFGFTHDGSIADMGTFLSAGVFTLTPDQVRHLAAFSMHFPTGTRPAVGRHLTVPAGAPPSGTAAEEMLLQRLMQLGDGAAGVRHCDLVAFAGRGGRARAYRWLSGAWVPDAAGEAPLTPFALRSGAEGPVSFLCGTIGSGARLGGDRDLDTFLNADDCGPSDPASWNPPAEVVGLSASGESPTRLAWSAQAAATGPGVRYDVAGGTIAELRSAGLAAATACLAGNLEAAAHDDARGGPEPGGVFFYLTRAENSCASGGFGPGRSALDPLDCR
jgi:YVTN family beta-propeller protein